jgi:hypothetical protein
MLLGVRIIKGAIVAKEEPTVTTEILSHDKLFWMFLFVSLTIFLIP